MMLRITCRSFIERGIRWPRVVGARVFISEIQRQITTNSGVMPSIMVGFEQFDVFWKDNLISHFTHFVTWNY